MKIELSTLKDGGIILASDTPFPRAVKRAEFYRDQRLMMLVYHGQKNEDLLMHCEVPKDMIYPIEKSPDIMIYTVFSNHEPIGYKVPLIKVGNLF